MRNILAALLFLLVAPAAQAFDLLSEQVTREGYAVHKDITYDVHERTKLDIYVPEKVKKKAPVVIFFHGGGWQSGNKDSFRFVGQALTSKGFIVVAPNYRLHPQVGFPTFINDGASAVKWVHDNIAQYGGDRNALFLSGHSAGGHIAMMIALDTHYLSDIKAKPEWIKGVIGFAGAYDFLPIPPQFAAPFASAAKPEDTQPIHFAHKSAPPALLLSGETDEVIPASNSLNLARALGAKGSAARVKTYPGLNHNDVLAVLAPQLRERAPVLEDVTQFINTYR